MLTLMSLCGETFQCTSSEHIAKFWMKAKTIQIFIKSTYYNYELLLYRPFYKTEMSNHLLNRKFTWIFFKVFISLWDLFRENKFTLKTLIYVLSLKNHLCFQNNDFKTKIQITEFILLMSEAAVFWFKLVGNCKVKCKVDC